MPTDEDSQPFDPKRRLCPDGSCIGVIGPDGRCNVCGRPAAGGVEPASLAADEVSPTDESDARDEPGVEDDAATGTAFDASRRLCSDGSCVGVIGADNRCRICGKPA